VSKSTLTAAKTSQIDVSQKFGMTSKIAVSRNFGMTFTVSRKFGIKIAVLGSHRKW
jgi:hypothetical protein